MAINSQKFLPSLSSSSAITNTVSSNLGELLKPNVKSKKQNFNILRKELIAIKIKTIKIDKILKKTIIFQKNNEKIKKKQEENLRFVEKENKLEFKPEKINEKMKTGIELPSLSLFDKINKFITFTFLGWLVNKFYKYIPQLLEFTKKIQPVIKFIESFVGNVFNGIVNFIDFGYDAHKKVSNFAKQIGGENFQKTFDDFSGNLNKFINLAIIAGMATMGGTDFGLGKKGGKPGSAPRPGQGGSPRVTTSGGGGAGRPDLRNPLRQRPNVTGTAGAPNIRNPLRQRPNITGSGSSALGKFGGKFAGKVFGRIPIIGGLVSFIISVLSGEPVGRAAAKAVGFSVGSALGTFIPIPFAGTILGGILGDIIGGALYDTIVGSKPDRKKVQGRNKGGTITRGGKKVGGAIKRTVRVTKSPPKVPPVKPGESIGGKKNLQKIFPEPTEQQKGKTVNPYGFLTDTANSFLRTDIAGALGSVFIKPFLGQLPTKQDYKNFGLAMNIWISNAMSKGLIGGNATGGFADGGIINNGMMGDISKWAEKSIEEMIKNKVTDAINDLRKNLGLEPLSGTSNLGEPNPTGIPLGEGQIATGVQLKNGLIQRGFTKEEASAIVGNLWAESGFRTDATNPKSGAFGLMQWLGGRKNRLYSYAAEKNKSATDVNLQLDYIKWELKGGNAYETSQFIKAMAYGTDIASKTRGFAQEVERASSRELNSSMSKRIGAAESVYGDRMVLGERQPTTRGTTGYKPRKPGLFNAVEYITGDRSQGSNFELDGHGLPANYHDHIAFATIADKERAKAALRKAGIQIGSELRSGDPGYHGANLAIDIPGNQWGGSGSIGKKEFDGSAKVRRILGLKDGGSVGFDKKSKNIGPIQNFPSYDTTSDSIFILPVIIEKVVPVKGSGNAITFPSGSVNSSNRSNLSAR